VAEGVETADSVETLRNLGCDVGQGFAFAAPEAAPDVSTLLAQGA
jgi:EAL domain-containing protein (putative c-di-GMP-specific phosphodiesterase class I)